MKRVDELLDQMPEPVEVLVLMSKEDQNSLIIAALLDLQSDDPVKLTEIFEEFDDFSDEVYIDNWIEKICSDSIDEHEKNHRIKEIYGSIESVINDRIDLYNAS